MAMQVEYCITALSECSTQMKFILTHERRLTVRLRSSTGSLNVPCSEWYWLSTTLDYRRDQGTYISVR